MGGKGGGQTIGFHYLFDILFGLGRGPINELVQINVADKAAWTGSVDDNTVFAINKPSLFGGEKKEGGIQGPASLFMGAGDQILPGAQSINCGKIGPMSGTRTLPAVKTAIGGNVSEMRGTTMLWYSGLISSMNPYPKEWSFRVRRYNAGWHNNDPWYPLMARIVMGGGAIHAMNPAHMIYECFTNPLWGRGLPAAMINENSFIYAANRLCTEGFGMCLAWQRKEEIDQFVGLILEHIAGGYYTDPETGKIVLKLIRADYDAEELPLFTPTSGLLDIIEDDTSSGDDGFSEIVGVGRDPITNKDFQIRLPNIAVRQSQGSHNPLDKDFSGIPTRDLLARVLQRELRVHSSGLKKLQVVLDRRGWKIRPGMCFRVQDARRGFDNIVLRAGEITDQSFKDGRVTLKAVQDVYGLPATSFVTPTTPTWEPPPVDAVPPIESKLVEANYRDIVRKIGTAQVATLDPTDALMGAMSVSPNAAMYEYLLATRAFGETDFRQDVTGSFTGAATLVDAIGFYDTEFTLTGAIDIPTDIVGQMILIDDEQMGVVSYDDTTHVMEVERGAGDTIPAEHAAAATMWTLDDDIAAETRQFASGETVEAYVLTKTLSDVLDPADTDLLSIDLVGRQGRPYPPGNVECDGELIFAMTLPFVERDEPLIEWVHRDRILQEDQIVGHTEGSVGPEAGVTYTIRVYDQDDPLGPPIRTEALIAGTSWQYLNADQGADGDPIAVWIELESERDGFASYQRYRFFVVLQSGYGLGYGNNYGGATV